MLKVDICEGIKECVFLPLMVVSDNEKQNKSHYQTYAVIASDWTELNKYGIFAISNSEMIHVDDWNEVKHLDTNRNKIIFNVMLYDKFIWKELYVIL